MSSDHVHRVSLNEIQRVSEWILRARGIDCGNEDEPARAVAWLAARHDDALAGLLADLRAGALRPPAPMRPVTGEGAVSTLDAGGVSALVVAPPILDWLQTRAAPRHGLKVVAAASPLWWLPHLALHPSPAARTLRASAPDGAAMMCLHADAGDGHHIELEVPAIESFATQAVVELNEAGHASREDPVPGSSDPNAMDRRAARSLAEGVAVDPRVWSALERCAYEAYVPESDESRMRGAGGGDDGE